MARVPALVVHGGAGSWASAHHEAARAGCRAAAAAGLDVLARGGSAVDAVMVAVRALEDDPMFNAGVGAALTRAETVELDAAVMDGRDLRYGGVGAMANVRQPIDVARAVMDDGVHALLCGEGAWAFARERGFAPCDPAALRTDRSLARLRAYLLDLAASEAAGADTPEPPDAGTVGACAMDAHGHVAAATSTGGITGKRPGRVGDTPLPGCGTYADDRGGAASATGEGEAIMRVAMTKACVMRMASGHTARAAARACVDELGRDTGRQGGIICCDPAGRLAAAHNSPEMPFAAGVLRAGGRALVDGMALAPGVDLMALLAGSA